MGSLPFDLPSIDVRQIVADLGIEISLVAIVGCIVLAFFGMRLYKVVVAAIGAVGLGYVAHVLLSEGGALSGFLPAEMFGVSVPLAVTVLAAVIGLILGVVLQKFVLFLGGIGGGYLGVQLLLPMFAPDLELDPMIVLAIGVGAGVIIGILLCLIFKPTYIIITSVGSMAVAAVILLVLAAPGIRLLFAAAGGAAVGIIPMIVQFKTSDDYYLY